MKLPLKLIFALFGAVLLGILYYKLTWFGLPLRRTPGHLDSLFVCLCLSAGTLVVSFLPRWLALALHLPVLAFASILVVANWWHVEFYRDIIVPSSFLYGADLMQSSRSISSLGPLWPGVAGILLILTMGAAVLWQQPGKLAGRSTLACTGLMLVLAGYYYHQGATRYPDRIPVGGMHPLAGFLREIGPSGSQQPELKHYQALAAFKPSLTQNSRSAEFPLLRTTRKAPAQPQAQMNILLVVLESVRASDTGFWGGVPITPNLDALAKRSVVATEFYANATQTIRGEMAILCSLLDYNRGAPFSESGARLRQHCLPEILAQHGYSTHWIHGYRSDFFKRDLFLPQVGFEHIHDQTAIRASMPNAINIGWGIRDEDTMAYAIDMLSQQAQPFFAEVLTLSNHHPFEWEWEHGGADMRHLDDHGELAAYHKGIHYTDYAVGKLVAKFDASPLAKNTVLIITGDHGVWHFDKQKEHSSMFVLNEKYFRLPFIMHLPQQTQARQLDFVASQVDIAPSLLDLLQIQHDTAFLGQSMLSEPEDERFAIMEKIGGAGFRRGDVACYPVSESCEGAYAMCDSRASFSYACGQASRSKPNYGAVQPIDDSLRAMMQTTTLVAEYMNRAHLYGFVPDLSRSREEGPTKGPSLFSRANAKPVESP